MDFVYSWWAGLCLPALSGSRFPLECTDDVDPVCYQERVPQQAPQHPDGVEHRFLSAFAHADDDDLACLLSGSGQRGIGRAAGGAPSRISHIQSSRLLPGKDSCHSRSSGGGAGLVVRRNLQRPEAGEFFRAIRHRSGGIFQGLPRRLHARGTSHGVAARPAGRDCE